MMKKGFIGYLEVQEKRFFVSNRDARFELTTTINKVVYDSIEEIQQLCDDNGISNVIMCEVDYEWVEFDGKKYPMISIESTMYHGFFI